MRYAETGFQLEVDLSKGSIDKVETDPRDTALYLGGNDMNAKLLFDRVPPGTDPWSPDNLLIFGNGLLNGTCVPGANRVSVNTIAPVNGFFGHSLMGGFFGAEMKMAGYDRIVIRGEAPDLVYLAIHKTVTDTNMAQDWANDRTVPVTGRRTQFPGWDLERFWQTAKVTGTAALTVSIAPDNAYRVISGVLGSARSSIKMEMHTFDNLGLLDVMTKTIGRGVSVTILLEGGPPGGIDNHEKWVCQQIEAAGGQCWFMITDTSGDNHIHSRYRFLHAKMIVVDDRVVAIGSENFSPRSLTYDDPADGTRGRRGVYLVTDAGGVVSRALEIWNADFDPAHHRDVFRWSPILTGTYGPPPISFAPDYSTAASGYRIRYPVPLTVTAPVTLVS